MKAKILNNIKSITIAVLVALIFKSFIIQTFVVPSGSMYPNLQESDYLFANKFHYGYTRYSLPGNIPLIPGRIFANKPTRGDIIVFRYPGDERTYYVKRLIGMPGDTIQFLNGNIYINSILLKQEKTGVAEFHGRKVEVYKETLNDVDKSYAIYRVPQNQNNSINNTILYKVPEGHYFMVGDNRDFSKDSRFSDVGYVDDKYILGNPNLIFFSVENGSILKLWTWGNIRFNRLFTRPS